MLSLVAFLFFAPETFTLSVGMSFVVLSSEIVVTIKLFGKDFKGEESGSGLGEPGL